MVADGAVASTGSATKKGGGGKKGGGAKKGGRRGGGSKAAAKAAAKAAEGDDGEFEGLTEEEREIWALVLPDKIENIYNRGIWANFKEAFFGVV